MSRIQKRPCDRCGAKKTRLYCWPVGKWWDRSICEHCVFVLRNERDRAITGEVERMQFKKNEAWSLNGPRDWWDLPFFKDEWDEARRIVDERAAALEAVA